MFVTVFTRDVPKISFEVNCDKIMTEVWSLVTAGMFLDNYNATDNFVAHFKKRHSDRSLPLLSILQS
jgi:hypothetical protein